MFTKASFTLLFIAVFLVGSEAQISTLTVPCRFENFEISGTSRYGCIVENLEADFSSPFYFIRIEGNHIAGQNNAAVLNLRFADSLIARIPANIFAVFQNVEALEVENCGSINFIPPDFYFADNLREVRIINNQMAALGPSPFVLAPSVEILILENNGLNTLGPQPFAGLVNLQTVSFANNNVSTITPGMTAILASLRNFDASNNAIREIDGRLFLNSADLRVVNFTGNTINAIGSNILNVNENLEQVSFGQNDCVDENFVIGGDVNLGTIRTALEGCFNNSPWGTQITVEVVGRVVIFDENNQIVATIE